MVRALILLIVQIKEVNKMYAFGVDVPLVELLIGIIVVSVIILIEITIVLVMLMYKLRSFKRLHDDAMKLVGRLREIESKKRRK